MSLSFSDFLSQYRMKRATFALFLAVPIASILGVANVSSAAPFAQPAIVSGKAPTDQIPAPLPQASAAELAPQPVTVVRPKVDFWPDLIEVKGNIMPWQESLIGTEVGGLRLVSVQAGVGDVVKKGQVLARLNPASVEIELEAANAQMVEAEVTLAQAAETLERAKRLAPSGGVSQQEMTRYETQKHTAEARLNAARAQVKKQRLRLDLTTLSAPDDGVISSSSAAEGAIVQAGSELFRLIRQGRLEWRAEVNGEMLMKLVAGQNVMVHSPLGAEFKGSVRQVSPTIDLTTRTGLVYVDLPAETNFKAGLRVSGTLALGKRKVLVLPSSAVLNQEGSARVFKVNGYNKIDAVDVKIGRSKDNWVEITAGLDEHTQVVANSETFLKN